MNNKLKEIMSGGKARIRELFRKIEYEFIVQNPERISQKTAQEIANHKLKEIMSGGKIKIRELCEDTEYEFPVQNGIEYQVRMMAYPHHKEKDLITILVEVDDGRYWDRKAHATIKRSELKTNDVS